MAVMKNNLGQHLKWLEESKANVPTKEALKDITTAIVANANTLPNRSHNNSISSIKSSTITEVASAPSRQPADSIQRIESNAEYSPILSNVEKTTRKSSGLRLARRDNSIITKSSGSTSSTSKHSSPQPQPARSGPAVIDLTFDDEVDATSTVPRRRPNENIQENISRSKKHKPNDFTSDDFDDTEFNEELRLHEIRKQNSFTTNNTAVAANVTVNSTISNTTHTSAQLFPPPVPLPIPVVSNEFGTSDLVQAQKEHIDICERRIELLVKRVAINESTALSEDEKKRKRNELSAELIQLEKDQKQSKAKINSVPLLPRQLRAHQPSNVNTSNILSSRAAMEVLESSRNTRETRDRRPSVQPANIQSVNSDDLVPTMHDDHGNEVDDEDDEEIEDIMGDKTNDGLLTSQVQDNEPHQSDLDFLDGDINDEGTDGSYTEDDDDGDESEEDIRHVSHDEVRNLQNDSDDEIEDRIEGDNNSGIGYDRANGNLGLETVESEDDDIEMTVHSIRSENVTPEDENDEIEIEEPVRFNDERETMHNYDEFIQIDSDFDLDEVPLPPLRPQPVAAPPQPIVNEEDFDATFPPSSPVEEISNIKEPLPPTENYPWTEEVFAKLKDIFKLTSFRPNQLDAVNGILSGRDTFVLMPTGGGKSLCYQLPAVVKSGKTQGTTIVVSPLISLMQDQVEHLWEKNIKAGMINSKGSAEERKTTFNLFIDGFLDLVYLSPEMISASNQAKNAIDRLYRQGKLARVVVDEAHCVSSWGHDFRPDYKHLSYFKEHYADIPVMALTATANDHVKMDIIHNLNLHDPLFLKQSFNRINLFYEVLTKDKDHMKQIETNIRTKFREQTGIIYCHSKNACEQTSEKLINGGIKCAFYHAGMTPEDRLDIQKQWQQGTIKVICATIAFGMGIDKPDVRFVIHLTIPRTLEGYYQETGRAGRDGKYSYCTMYYSFRDARTLQNMISRDKDLDRVGKEKHLTKLRQVIQYCENATDCRRQQVLQYFNEEFDKKDCEKNCDNCQRGADASTMYDKDVTEYAKKMAELVKSLEDQKVTLIYCQDVFKGSKTNKITSAGHDDLPQHGAGKELDKVDIERIAFHLIAEKILEEYSVFNAAGFASSYIRIGPESSRLFQNQRKIIMTFSTHSKRTRSNGSNGPNRAPTNPPANRPRTLNHDEMEGFRYDQQQQQQAGVATASATSSFTSARVHLQRTASNVDNNTSPATPIQLRDMPFESEEERINFTNAYKALAEARYRAMNGMSLKSTNSVCNDDVLRKVSKTLPSESEFKQITGLASGQRGYYKYFRTTIETLQAQRKSRPAQRTAASASELRSRYFRNPAEVEENRTIIEKIRSTQPVASQSGGGTSTQKRTVRSSQNGKGKRRGKSSYNKRSNNRGGGGNNKTTGEYNQRKSSSQTPKKAPTKSTRPTQTAMPL